VNFHFHPEADEEFIEAVAYYEGCELGLGLDFSREVHASILNALSYRPMMWPEIDEEVRRCLVHRFPYAVLYSMEPDGILNVNFHPKSSNPDDAGVSLPESGVTPPFFGQHFQTGSF